MSYIICLCWLTVESIVEDDHHTSLADEGKEDETTQQQPHFEYNSGGGPARVDHQRQFTDDLYATANQDF